MESAIIIVENMEFSLTKTQNICKNEIVIGGNGRLKSTQQIGFNI